MWEARVPYALGIDLGTTFSAAAVSEQGRTEIVALGNRAAAVPTVVLVRADGEVLIGEAAERRAVSEPLRTAREFKRRLGDPTPIMLAGTPYGAEALYARMLRGVVYQVVEERGERPEAIVVAHPATYGPYKLDLLHQAVRMAEIGPVTFIT
jgi:molecular chaperone DnaK (HSP70)